MIVGQLSRDTFRALLAGSGLRVKAGPFNLSIRTRLPYLADQLHRMYAHYALMDEAEIAEFHVQVISKRSIRRPFARLIQFEVDGRSPFPPVPAEQALATLEWGINLAIAMRINHLLLFHSAAVERNGHVLLLPAWPGSGKTTLCTALIHRGYRLFSDEFGLMDPQSGNFFPLPRLMPLKNQSIEIIRNYLPEAVLGPEIPGTLKGTVAHVRPPQESIERSDESAKARWIVFPKWSANASLQLEPLPQSEAFLLLASNAFNYEVLGETAFDAVTSLVRNCECRKLVYSGFDSALAALDELTDD
ncbi:HprK-related kinase A [Betaproteobacteria bacterium PRO4]|uniref:HprK-related kinase A n=1 Tax=Nitrosomonas sp. TaxID=42353 RepID=UPI0025692139|nr:HprK-related kinase A [Nitrosomonas sp.]MDL1865949.1 HprK-related kinase A [Betaproteobacteria bacterium PRO4]